VTEQEDVLIIREIHRLLLPHTDIVGLIELDGDRLTTRIEGQQLAITAKVITDQDAHSSVAHAHIIVATDDEELFGNLEACVVGINLDRHTALRNTAESWFTSAAGPIFSLFHARPVLDAIHFDGEEVSGVRGAHGFAGPLTVRMASEEFPADRLLEQPMFQYVPEMAPPGIVHLAKVTLQVRAQRWHRTIEVDGHQAVYADASWDAGQPPPRQVVASRFATFHYANQPEVVETRRVLDEVICDYVRQFDQERDTNRARNALVNAGRPEKVVDRVDHFLRLALGRVIITNNMPFHAAMTYHRVQPSGELKLNEPLMEEPAFVRGMALAGALADGPLLEATRELALCSAEVDVINQALNAGSRLEDCHADPFLIPDLGTSREVFSKAVECLRYQPEHPSKKPWWKIW
jgi:hypothetical protein